MINPNSVLFNPVNSKYGYNSANTLPAKMSQENKTKSIFSSDENLCVGLGELKKEAKQAKDEQGIIGKAWNGLKNTFGFGLSSNDVDSAIESYKKGEISYEEAQNTIQSFQTKQKGMVDIITNVAGGVITAATAVATGGLSLGVIATGAAVGAVSKAGIKTFDRATNNVKNDALDAKQIAKDGLTGAVDGAMTVVTAGMVKPLTTASIAGKTAKQVVVEGAVQGAKAGALTGAATGAANYTVDAVFEDDVEFNADELLNQTLQNAAAGGVFGGVMGGVTNAFQYKKVYNQTMDELHETADMLAQKYKEGIDDVRQSYKADFDGTTDDALITARSKSNDTDSVFNKLKSKFDSGKLKSTDFDSCAKVIGDGYGVRIQMEKLDASVSREIIENGLQGTGKTYDDFVEALKGDKIPEEYLPILDKLKEKQTEDVFNRLVKLIDDRDLTLAADEFNNYGDDITAYFTDEQLERLANTYFDKTGKPLDLVNRRKVSAVQKRMVFDETTGTTVSKEVDAVNFGEKAIKKSTKTSGYTSAQGNMVTDRTTGGLLGDTEIQLRGKSVNAFSDVEHIPYDIRQGKITASDDKYKAVYDIFKGMSDDSYKAYNKYLQDTYRYLRLEELGITTSAPTLPRNLTYAKKGIFGKEMPISQADIDKITKEGLALLH